MIQVFVDTGGFYAALNRKDQYHREATVLFARAVEEAWQLFTSNFVVSVPVSRQPPRRGYVLP
jgi:predicted nucleic acid-binding protein